MKGEMILFSRALRFGLIDSLCRKICFKYREKWWIGSVRYRLCFEMEKPFYKYNFFNVILLISQNRSMTNQYDWNSMQKGWNLNLKG
ncbi:hypothetical protein EB354_16440 [Chryseobacterium balustinum]|nr:hypothetical protein EB354_16440 [Chryseobacterium balustinum]